MNDPVIWLPPWPGSARGDVSTSCSTARRVFIERGYRRTRWPTSRARWASRRARSNGYVEGKEALHLLSTAPSPAPDGGPDLPVRNAEAGRDHRPPARAPASEAAHARSHWRARPCARDVRRECEDVLGELLMISSRARRPDRHCSKALRARSADIVPAFTLEMRRDLLARVTSSLARTGASARSSSCRVPDTAIPHGCCSRPSRFARHRLRATATRRRSTTPRAYGDHRPSSRVLPRTGGGRRRDPLRHRGRSSLSLALPRLSFGDYRVTWTGVPRGARAPVRRARAFWWDDIHYAPAHRPPNLQGPACIVAVGVLGRVLGGTGDDYVRANAIVALFRLDRRGSRRLVHFARRREGGDRAALLAIAAFTGSAFASASFSVNLPSAGSS